MKTEDFDIYTESERIHGCHYARQEYLYAKHLPSGISVKLPVDDGCREAALSMIEHGLKVTGWRDEP